MAKIAPLCSSSKGNSVFVGDNRSGILVDIGCSYKALKSSLDLCGIPFEAVKAVVITHEHTDHVKGLFQFTKHTDIPVFASVGTARRLYADNLVNPGTVIHYCDELGTAPIDMDISAFHTPHDSAESVGYTFSFGEHKVALCTDLGYVTNEVKENLLGCDTVYLEANYDKELLRRNTSYPPYLKKRISSDKGHLSNNDSADFCAKLVQSGTRRLILGHLSKENNTADTAYKTVSANLSDNGMICGRDYTLDVAKIIGNGEYISF